MGVQIHDGPFSIKWDLFTKSLMEVQYQVGGLLYIFGIHVEIV